MQNSISYYLTTKMVQQKSPKVYIRQGVIFPEGEWGFPTGTVQIWGELLTKTFIIW